MKRNGFLVIAIAGLAACSSGGAGTPRQPAPAQNAEVAAAGENPCLDETLLLLRRKVPMNLSATEQRELRERNDACAAYRLAQRRPGDPVTAADYEREVLPWLFGIAVFTGTLYLFTNKPYPRGTPPPPLPARLNKRSAMLRFAGDRALRARLALLCLVLAVPGCGNEDARGAWAGSSEGLGAVSLVLDLDGHYELTLGPRPGGDTMVASSARGVGAGLEVTYSGRYEDAGDTIHLRGIPGESYAVWSGDGLVLETRGHTIRLRRP